MTNHRDQEVDTLYIQEQHLHVQEDTLLLAIPSDLVKNQEMEPGLTTTLYVYSVNKISLIFYLSSEYITDFRNNLNIYIFFYPNYFGKQ